MTLGIATASAHTPSYSATCSGVTASGTAYGQAGATLTVTVGPNQGTKKIGDSGSLTVPVPQDYQTYTWTVDIDAPGHQYDLHQTGTVGPCGEKPKSDQPSDQVVTTPETKSDCDSEYSRTKTTTTPYVWDEVSWSWILGAPVTTYTDWAVTGPATDADKTANQCQPPQPADQVTPFSDSTTDCAAGIVTTRHWTITRPYVWDADSSAWVLGPALDPVYGDDTTAPADSEACPVDKPTTPDEPTAPPVEQPTTPAPAAVLPAPQALPADAPAQPTPTTVTPKADARLAYTGADITPYAWSAAGLIVFGGLALAAGRKRGQS